LAFSPQLHACADAAQEAQRAAVEEARKQTHASAQVRPLTTTATSHAQGRSQAAPAVNQLRVRENGPYAVHAPIQLAGTDDGFRATLCRCGLSQNKPWCDGSHVGAHFQATGEPPSGAVDPLAVRNGPLAVTPLRNGPLRVEGNLEICAGTGRTVARVTEARLCRCGQSRNKPFCDLSHVGAGFEAEGA
jgi:CDGSH-type Zn-finger protein